MTVFKRRWDSFLLLILLFITGVGLGIYLWTRICLPLSFPLQVISQTTLAGFNPINNLFRFLCFISLPSLLLLGVYALRAKEARPISLIKPEMTEGADLIHRHREARRKWAWWLGVISLTLLVGLNHPTYHAWGPFDFFHEGESLTAAQDYLAGKIPYKDSTSVHGVIQDPLRSVAAFAIFGRSIGSARAFESAIKIVSFVLLSFVLMMVTSNPVLTAVSLTGLGLLDLLSRTAFEGRVPLYILLPRDSVSLLFLLCLVMLAKRFFIEAKSRASFTATSVLFSFLPVFALGYSFDRGLFLIGAYLVFSAVLVFFLLSKKGQRLFIIGAAIGLVFGGICLGFMLKGSFSSFFAFVLDFIRYSDLIYGIAYPIEKARYALSLTLIAFLLFWTTHKALICLERNRGSFYLGIKDFFSAYFLEFSLLVMSLLFFKSALGRSDAEHLAYSLILPFILLVRITSNLLQRQTKQVNRFFMGGMLAALVLFLPATYFHMREQNILNQNFPLKWDDSRFVPERYRAPLSFLASNLDSKETIYVLTSELAWYYLLDRPTPANYYNIQIASRSSIQHEVVQDLQNHGVKYILYSEHSWDNISHDLKHPILMTYIRRNFRPHTSINGFNLWIRKEGIQWGIPTALPSSIAASAWFPDLAVDRQGHVHVVWCQTRAVEDKREHRFFEEETIVYSMWNRKKWMAPQPLIETQRSISRPALALDKDDTLYLSFTDSRGFTYSLLNLKTAMRPDNTLDYFWSDPMPLSKSGGTYMSDICHWNGSLHVLFDRATGSADCPNCADVFYLRTTVGDVTLGEPVNLSRSSMGCGRAQLKIDQGGTIHAVWDVGWDRLTGKGSPHHGIYRFSRDGGDSWSDPLMISYPHSTNVQIACGADGRNGIMLVWRTTTLEDPAIYYQWSKDSGRTWSSPERIPSLFARSWLETPFDCYDLATDDMGYIHLVAIGHLAKSAISRDPPKLLHLTWDGKTWSEPDVLFEGELYPEYPHLVIHRGNEFHITWFTREKLWKDHREVQHRVWHLWGKAVDHRQEVLFNAARRERPR